MKDTQALEDLATKLAGLLPPGLKGLREELRDNFRALLRSHLDRLDLVSRERFDAQAAVLARTREKLAALEARLKKIESTPLAPQERGAGGEGQR
ncbi:MAG: accessory factor UbiK family protein [Pseudomonadota bacterium]